MPSPLVDKTWQSSTLLLIDPPVTKVDMASPLVDKTLQRSTLLQMDSPKKPHTHKLFICNCELTIINEKQYCYTGT